MKNNRLSLNPSSVALLLTAVALLLVLISISMRIIYFAGDGNELHGFTSLFTLGYEKNIPNTFSVLLLFSNALLLWIIFLLKRMQKDTDLLYWAVLSFGFLYMSFDEACKLHERLESPIKDIIGNDNLGIFYYAWVIPGIILVLLLGLFFLRFLLRLPAKTRFFFLISAFLYLGGAIGFELIGGRYHELYGFENLSYYMIMFTEESLEMAGCIFFIWTLLKYIADEFNVVQFQFEKMHEESSAGNS